MLQRVILPQLGQTMEEGTIEKWHKSEGDPVKRGEVLYDLATDKATLEVEAFAEGTLRKVLVAEGQTVAVNRLIAIIGAPDEEIPESMLSEAPAPVPKAAAAREQGGATAPEEPQAAPAPGAPAGRTFASPRARKMAEEQKIPLQALRGAEPAGRIVERDVEAYLEKLASVPHTPTARAYAFAKGVSLLDVARRVGGRRVQRQDVEAAAEAGVGQAAAAGQRVALSHMRRTIASRMTQSKQSIPHFYLVGDVMMGAAMAYVKELSAASGTKVTLTPLLVKAVGVALKQSPRMNARFDRDAIVLNADCNVGVAVAVEDGLFVPVVRRSDGKGLTEIASELRSLAEAARQGKLIPEQYEGGSITISNLGMFGVRAFLPIINPPESCIIGVGAVTEQAVVVQGGIRVEPVMALSVSADHRVADGVIAAQFFSTLKALLERPEDLGG